MASASARIEWVTPPSRLAARVAAIDPAFRAELVRLGQTLARAGEAFAKTNAPWVNRTGFARASLSGTSESTGDGVAVTVAHGADYGIWLEVAHGRVWGILPRTIDYLTEQARAGVAGMLERVV